MLRVEHEAVVLIELGEAQPRLQLLFCQLLMGFRLYDPPALISRRMETVNVNDGI